MRICPRCYSCGGPSFSAASTRNSMKLPNTGDVMQKIELIVAQAKPPMQALSMYYFDKAAQYKKPGKKGNRK